MTLPGQLNPPQRLLLGPGPSDVHPRVLTAMATPLLGHLDPAFLEIMQRDAGRCCAARIQTKNPLTFPISATGMAGMETCFVNLLEPGDKCVVCVNGFFGTAHGRHRRPGRGAGHGARTGLGRSVRSRTAFARRCKRSGRRC